ncbi:ribosomal RNA small subunit methyltransferase A [Candidatus Parcubacteria bacterium]|nr:ribosomal RNA small subunit methyltransferase A [Candidatus Parcubacteria bacterium]
MSSQNNLLYHTKKLLKKYQVLPSKKLGQNFLIDKTAIKKIIAAANLQPKDVVLEIGPGTGTLTQEIAKKVKQVIAVEKDAKMREILKETMKEYKNVKIIQADILKVINNKLSIINQGENISRPKLSVINYKVIGNLPFYLTAPVIRKFLELFGVRPRTIPQQMVFVVQKEVGQRICPPRRARSAGEAGAKLGKMNLLAVSVQFYANVKIIAYISKKCFWPQPKVDSAIIKITPLINADKNLINADLFFRIVKAGFSQPRKQLLNTLSSGLKVEREKTKNWLLKNNIPVTQRPETLSIKDWMLLVKNMPRS